VPLYIGIDGCRSGWCVAELGGERLIGLSLVRSFEEVARRAREARLTFLDMPIGLPDGERRLERACETLARKTLGGRGSSIFPVPVRPALEAATYEEASRIQQCLTGKRLTRQTWALFPRMRAVDKVMRADPDLAELIKESHPEMGFAVLNGGEPVPWSKRHLLGLLERIRLLEEHLPGTRDALYRFLADLSPAAAAGDDALDALVLAVNARLADTRGMVTFPAEPERDGYGLPMQISRARLVSPAGRG